MKIIIILTVLAAFCTLVPSNAQVEHRDIVINIACDDTIWLDWCLDEPIEGTIVYSEVVRLDKDGHWKDSHLNIKFGNVTGCKSGKAYKVIDLVHDKNYN